MFLLNYVHSLHCLLQYLAQHTVTGITTGLSAYLYMLYINLLLILKSFFSAPFIAKLNHRTIKLLIQFKLAQKIVYRIVHDYLFEQLVLVYQFTHWSSHDSSVPQSTTRSYYITCIDEVMLGRGVSESPSLFFPVVTHSLAVLTLLLSQVLVSVSFYPNVHYNFNTLLTFFSLLWCFVHEKHFLLRPGRYLQGIC